MLHRAVVFFCIVTILLGMAVPGFTQEYRDDSALAERYVEQAREAIRRGSLDEAERILNAAQDFSDVSSDASYLLAQVQMDQKRPAASILHAVKQARETAHWVLYTDQDAALIEVRMLLQLRSFSEILSILPDTDLDAESAYYRLKAYAGLRNIDAYMDQLRFMLSAYPMDTRAVSYHLRHAALRLPYPGEQRLMDRILSALPVLKQQDPSLAYLAAPFIQDNDTRRRLIAEYRAMNKPDVASLPVSLEYGIIDEAVAVRDLFASSSTNADREEGLDRQLVSAVWAQLRHEEGRRLYRQAAAMYSGWILEDVDMDGFPEAKTRYYNGSIVRYEYDMDQDGIDDLILDMDDGMPVQGKVLMFSELKADEEALPFSRPLRAEDLRMAQLDWIRYPYLERVKHNRVSYYPAPKSFPLSPVQFVPLIPDVLDFPVMYPLRDSLLPRLTERSLLSFANIVERPGTRTGASDPSQSSIERIRFLDAVPIRSEELFEGSIIARTEYIQGRPYMQHIDLDMDGRLETRRRFRIPEEIPYDPLAFKAELEFSESDWNGDGLYEYAEYYYPDSSMEKSWDTNGDGFRDRSEKYVKE